MADEPQDNTVKNIFIVSSVVLLLLAAWQYSAPKEEQPPPKVYTAFDKACTTASYKLRKSEMMPRVYLRNQVRFGDFDQEVRAKMLPVLRTRPRVDDAVCIFWEKSETTYIAIISPTTERITYLVRLGPVTEKILLNQ